MEASHAFMKMISRLIHLLSQHNLNMKNLRMYEVISESY